MKKLELRFAELSESYRKKWNIHLNDYRYLYKDGKKVSDVLYRIGGMGAKLEDSYFMILKHCEAVYSDVTIDKERRNHLDDHWCIMNQDGEEKVVFEKHDSGVYLQGGLIYTKGDYYYNIETGYCYGSANKQMSSKDFLFIDLSYYKVKEERGILKINKFDGTTELFPSK
jgi:hypothetical protein